MIYRPYRNERVRLVGGRRVTNFGPIRGPEVRNRLDRSARAHVVVADLRSIGVSEYGSPVGGGLELFCNGQPMTLARWPNEGFVRIAEIAAPLDRTVHGRKGSRIGKFVYEGDRPRRWLQEPDLWLHGYWFWDWSDQRQKVKSIDVEKKTIELQPPYHHYGYRKGQWYYAFNALSEIDSPGEWYLDRQKGRLYFWPPQPVERSEAIVSVLPSLVRMRDVSHVTLRGFMLEATRGTAVTIRGGEAVRVEGCTLRNAGAWAVTVAGGRHHVVRSCDIFGTGGGGISLSGGNRRTLTPGGHQACNNHIHHYARWYRMYHPGIALTGVGNRACHNLIHHAPHQALTFGGNDHVIEWNEIHHVCLESNDAGAVYCGRDWTMRGTVIRNNYFHHITGFQNCGCMGVYLDDMFCGTRIEGNVFYKVTRAAFIGGGRDNAIVNNIFVDCRPAVHVDARAMSWASYHVNTTMTQRLKAMPYTKPPWSERYPRLVTILDDDPAAPKGNLIARNICVGGRWDEIEAKARPLITFRDNLIDVDPQFVDADHQDFRLKKSSPAFRMGFEPIPFDQIGLFRDDLRRSVTKPMETGKEP
ncbi:MAG: right-handed parallel beta-helix repeat-containing protein [Planctomycetes bacterium]|nr:right-handed parallel beta-helix repeat-containing protein [Planctomycetota bacterium]